MNTRFSILLLSLLAIGCKTDTEGVGSCSSPGSEGCACTVEGLCLSGLTCASDTCVDLGGMSTTGDDSDSSTSSTSSTSDDSKGSDSSTTSTTDPSTTDPSTSTTDPTGDPPPMKPDIGGPGCTPGDYGCDCDCSSGLFCECDAPFVCQGAENICGLEECLAPYEECFGAIEDCCGEALCLGNLETEEFACVEPCTTDADCPVTCCVAAVDEFFCAPSNYYC